MKNVINLIILTIILTAIGGCCDAQEKNTDPVRLYFERIFMNESHRYTLLTDGIPQEIDVDTRTTIQFFYDVPENKPMYIIYIKDCQGGTPYYTTLYIHIHSVRDINGGGWNHGKFGHGKTTVIN